MQKFLEPSENPAFFFRLSKIGHSVAAASDLHR
jgi:hypothetical protein